MNYQLITIKQGTYLGNIKTFYTKTSDRTGKTYLNLVLTIEVEGELVDIRKSYCLDIGYNYQVIELMEDMDVLEENNVVDLERLFDFGFWVIVGYNFWNQLEVTKLRAVQECEWKEMEEQNYARK